MTITHRMRDGGPRAEDDTGQPTAGTPPQQQQQQRPPRPPPVPVTAAARGGHPCFWAVLDGESLNFAFVSASLHSFLGGEQAAGVLGESLFDYIHPEEASRARRDLVDTFVSKSLVGSSIRCRLRRFDLEKPGFQYMFRRASESQILHRGRPAQHLHESLERKLSLPSIPDIVKLRANRPHLQPQPQPPPPPSVGPGQPPMPKRLRTILEDSVGTFAPAREGSSAASPAADGPPPCDEFLVASIGLYLVSARLVVMICHYEDAPPATSRLLLNAARCDCALDALPAADAERVQHLLSQIHKLDAIPAPRGYTGLAARAGTQQRVDSGGGSGGGGGGGGSRSISSLASRHVQIYTVGSEKLLCAFPEDGYQRVHGRSPAAAAASGAGLRGLWKHVSDKKAHAHAMALLQGPLVPDTGPIRLELQLRPDGHGASADAQSILFRWGSLLFVCQQTRSDSTTPELGPAAMMSGDDNALLSYNLTTPPSEEPVRGITRPDRPVRQVHSANGVAGARGLARTSSPLGSSGGGGPPDIRPFSLPRAPASVAANLPARVQLLHPPPPPPVAGVAAAVPPRRQSSHTLPPAKTFEERRFSFPTQTIYSERRPPPLPIPGQLPQQHQLSQQQQQHQQQQHQHQQHQHLQQHQNQNQNQHQHQHQGPLILCASPAGSAPGSGMPRNMSNAASPADAHRRASSSAVARGAFLGKADGSVTPSQTTPVSPMSAGAAQHTSASLSPVPPQPHSANPGQVQVNIYPPPEPTVAWRWPHGHHPAQPPPPPPTLPPTPNSCRFQHGYPQTGQRPSPALTLGRGVHSPHAHIMHGMMHEQYHSVVGAAIASPRSAGPLMAGRAEREKKTCKSCGTDSSPEWRKGPTGHKTLCNACGLRYARSISRAKKLPG